MKTKSALIIEDDPDMRRVLDRMIQRKGWETRTAANGREGLRLFRERACELVVSDLIMPDMEGLETIRTLREWEEDLTIIAISGGGHKFSMPVAHLLRTACHLGANVALEKPFRMAHLESCLDRLCRKEQGHQNSQGPDPDTPGR